MAVLGGIYGQVGLVVVEFALLQLRELRKNKHRERERERERESPLSMLCMYVYEYRRLVMIPLSMIDCAGQEGS